MKLRGDSVDARSPSDQRRLCHTDDSKVLLLRQERHSSQVRRCGCFWFVARHKIDAWLSVVGEVEDMEQEIARSVQDLLVKLSEECAARNWSAEDVFKRCVKRACAHVSGGRLIACVRLARCVRAD